MAAERVLPLPLSGLEIRKAILDILGRSLEQDGRLNSDTAFDSARCKVTLCLSCHDIGRVVLSEVNVEVHGAAPGAEEAVLEGVEKQFDIEMDSPTEVRVSTGQPVPVSTKDHSGKEVTRHVQYSRKDAAKAK